MKRNKLYTVNKWNIPAFTRGNIYDGITNSTGLMQRINPYDYYVNPTTGLGVMGNINKRVETNLGTKPNITLRPSFQSSQDSSGVSSALAGANAVAPMLSSVISDGYEGAGTDIAKVGSTIGTAVSMIPGGQLFGTAINIGSNIVGGLGNRLFGLKTNQAKLNQAHSNINYLKGFNSNASSMDDIQGPESVNLVTGVYKGGLLRSASNENDIIENQQKDAMSQAQRSVENNIHNIIDDKKANFFYNGYNKVAFGGPIEQINDMSDDMGAINYGFMSDYLTQKKQQNDLKNKIGNQFAGVPDNMFAIGGDLQTHGGDYSDGLMTINAGLSHEENPYEGVQLGVDSEGIPNLVEEGEVVFNDYVYSNRINLDEEAKKKFHFPKKADITYANAAKRLEKEIKERPNDPISKAAFKLQMQQLADEQERQKQEMEAKRAQEAFAALSPEEQTAVMQQVAAQEQAAMQQQVMAEQQMQGAPVEQGVPEELMQQQMMPQEGDAMPVEQGVPVMAYGGKVNKFDIGGPKYKSALAWARKKGFGVNDAQYIAAALEKAEEKKGRTLIPIHGGESSQPEPDWDSIYDSMIPTWPSTMEKHFNEWIDLGVPRNLAFGISFPMHMSYGNRTGRSREEIYNELVRNYKKPASTPRTTSTGTSEYSPIPFETPSKFESAFSLERPAETTATPAPTVAQTPPVQGSSVAKAAVQPETPSPTPAATTSRGATPRDTAAPRVSRGNTPVDSVTGRPYDWYRNGSDGYSTPTGFTVGANGLIDKENGYTQEYRDLVGKLTADDIRKWASEHPNDTSLLSFLARGNKLEDLTTDQWRKGALDGKYGFMHHVADQLLNSPENTGTFTDEQLALQGRSPQVFHAMDGDDYDGYIEGELGPEVGAEVRRETLPNGDTVIYHTRVKPDEATATPGVTDGERRIVPVHRDERLRYAGLFGPAVGLGMQLTGIGKPDFSEMDKILANSTRTHHLAKYKPIGDYLRYRPMDVWYQQAMMEAQARGTDRSIMNSGLNQGSRNAAYLANGLNSQIANANLHRQALEYDEGQRARVGEFNRGTNQFNADAFNRLSQFNASEANRARQFNAQLNSQLAAQKMAADQAWNQGIYGNVAGLFKGISDLGTENYRHNRIADMAATGIFGTMKPETFVSNGMLRYETDEERNRRLGKINAKGGKLKRKKGLI